MAPPSATPLSAQEIDHLRRLRLVRYGNHHPFSDDVPTVMEA
jgi:hypothetical protein